MKACKGCRIVLGIYRLYICQHCEESFCIECLIKHDKEVQHILDIQVMKEVKKS
jgi:hypothetical protein